MTMQKTSCVICNSGKYKIICKNRDYRYGLSAKSFRLVKCAKCGLIYLNPRSSEKDIHKFYPQEYYGTQFGIIGEKIDNYFVNRKIYGMEKFKQEGKLLDIGCGTGDFLLQVQKRSYDVCGIDVSPQACKVARKKRLIIYHDDLKKHHFPAKSFDIITLWHVFEHLYNPSDILKEIKRILKDDGTLIMETPNIDCFSFKIFKGYHFHLDSPRHLHHWTKHSMELILNKNGFKVHKTEYPIFNYPLSSFHSFKNFSKSPLALIITLPFLALITVFSQSIPSRREVLRTYAGIRRFLPKTQH